MQSGGAGAVVTGGAVAMIVRSNRMRNVENNGRASALHNFQSRQARQQAEYLVANRTGHQHWMRIEMVIPVTREFQLRSLSTLLVVVGGFAIL